MSVFYDNRIKFNNKTFKIVYFLDKQPFITDIKETFTCYANFTGKEFYCNLWCESYCYWSTPLKRPLRILTKDDRVEGRI